jgi:hypothetical protein
MVCLNPGFGNISMPIQIRIRLSTFRRSDLIRMPPLRYRPARMDLHESGIIGKSLNKQEVGFIFCMEQLRTLNSYKIFKIKNKKIKNI